MDKLNLEMKQVQEQAAIAEVARESSERQVRELQRHIDEMERVGVRQLKNEIRSLERKVATCSWFVSYESFLLIFL